MKLEWEKDEDGFFGKGDGIIASVYPGKTDSMKVTIIIDDAGSVSEVNQSLIQHRINEACKQLLHLKKAKRVTDEGR